MVQGKLRCLAFLSHFYMAAADELDSCGHQSETLELTYDAQHPFDSQVCLVSRDFVFAVRRRVWTGDRKARRP